jgi:hypothetical protein
MRLTILTFIVFHVWNANSQVKTIWFENTYKENTTYRVEEIKNSLSTVTFKASPDKLGKLKSNGVKNPMVTKKQEKTIIIEKTGNFVNGVMNFVGTFIESNKENNPFLPGDQIFYSFSKANGVNLTGFSRDDIPNTKEIQESIAGSLNGQFFRRKKMEINDTFTLVTPFSLSLEGFQMNMQIVTIYKLTKIKKKEGIFAMVQYAKATGNIGEMNMKISGKGNGWVTYNIHAGRILKSNEKMTMTFISKPDKDITIEASVTEQTQKRIKAIK